MDEQIWELAARQRGLLSAAQLHGLGCTPAQRKRRVTTGRLVPVRRGIYATAGTPVETWEQHLMAAVLVAAPAVASHTSAAAMLDFDGFIGDRLELTSAFGHDTRPSGVTVHRVQRLPDSHVTERRGIPVTTPARTLVDLSGRVRAELLGRAFRGELRKGLSLDHVRACIDERRVDRARGLGAIERLVAEATPGLVRTRSDLEADALERIRRANLPAPVVNLEVTLNGRTYFVDLAWPAHRLGVELDTLATHADRFESDRQRDNAFQDAGWRIRRYTPATLDQLVPDLQRLLGS